MTDLADRLFDRYGHVEFYVKDAAYWLGEPSPKITGLLKRLQNEGRVERLPREAIRKPNGKDRWLPPAWRFTETGSSAFREERAE